MKPKHVSVVSHTHWDRAWYVSFQEFRVRLVRLIDNLLDILENDPQYKSFTLDGQMIVFEDYLEVKSENHDRIKKLVEEGRLHIGPWYVLADEFLVSPESLIRNLQLGHKMADDFNRIDKIGYVPDAFGHIAQLPQILRGFDIDNAVFWRGVGEDGERLGTEFYWDAPDGSSVIVAYMPTGYHNGANLGYPVHWGDVSMMELSYDKALEQIKDAIEELVPFANTDNFLLMNGIDHAEVQAELPQIIDKANREFDDMILEHSSLLEYFDKIRQQGSLPSYQGEFRWGKYDYILQSVYSTRIHLKQQNHQIQHLLEGYAEPLNALAYNYNEEYPAGLLWTAWKWLMKNHPHDDICGCSVDVVHEEMEHRFQQSRQIGEILTRNALRKLAWKIDWSNQEGIPIIVYNPNGFERNDVVETLLPVSEEEMNKMEDLRLVDGDNQDIPVQILGVEEEISMEVLKPKRANLVNAVFPVAVGSLGYKTYWLKSGRKKEETTGLKITNSGAENKYLSFNINDDGTINIFDKVTDNRYEQVHYFEDTEDAGDEYTYSPLAKSETITTLGCNAEISLLESGPLKVTYQIEVPIELPLSLAENRKTRSSERMQTNITSLVSLFANKQGLYIKTFFENKVEDHRLRAHFPTGINTDKSYADGHFMVCEREIDLPEADGWIEQPSPTKHQRAFVDINDDKKGLAILNKGLPEYETYRSDNQVTIALTLLRAVGWLSRNDLLTRDGNAGPDIPVDGQCKRDYVFEYAILPHEGSWEGIYQTAYDYVKPVKVIRGDEHEGFEFGKIGLNVKDFTPEPGQMKEIPAEGSLPDSMSFVYVEPEELILSAFKKSELNPGLILRLYNISSHNVSGKMNFRNEYHKIYLTNMNEKRQKLIATYTDELELEVAANEIITLELY